MTFQEFATYQEQCLRDVAATKEHAIFVVQLDQLYRRALELLPEERPGWIHCLLLCHKHFYAAVGNICRGQPQEADVIVRRAIEVAKHTTALHYDQSYCKRYTENISTRQEQWASGQIAKKASYTASSFPKDNRHVSQLEYFYDLLSNSTGHPNPELMALAGFTATNSKLQLLYFSSPAEIAAGLRLAAAVFLTILELADQWDGSVLLKDSEFKRLHTAYVTAARANSQGT